MKMFLPTISFMITIAILLMLMTFFEFAPFGNTSFASADASIQYLDFFAYLKRLFEESASYSFTFEKGLGGNIFAVLTYYLASPLNLLILFFDQVHLHEFYNIVTILKFSLSGFTMAYYLGIRFENKIAPSIIIALSVGFALMTYNLEQARNVMWLDGVYMLPMMMLGLHYLHRNGNIIFLSITSALSIIFNWYSGFINLAFIVLFALWEGFFVYGRIRWKEIFLSVIFAVGMIAFIFLPTMSALSDGRAEIDWNRLSLRYAGNPINLLQGLSLGSVSEKKQAALFVGDLATVGLMLFFQTVRGKVLRSGLILVAFMLLMFYWQPLVFLFSLLKDVSSYWYRYSYLASFLIIYIAGIYFSSPKEHKNYFVLAIYPAVLIIMQLIHPINSWFNTTCSMLIYVILLKFYKNPVIMIPVVIVGLCHNCVEVGQHYTRSNVNDYKNYVSQQKLQISELKELDSGVFRINQTNTYNVISDRRTANYNEGLAYGYNSLASYTSSPVNAGLYFLDHIGFAKNGDNMNIVNLPIIASDSLLGVKYVLSDIPIKGLRLVPNSNVHNGKLIYVNDFAFPLAFVCSDIDLTSCTYRNNSFEYVNRIYQKLFGENVEIYQRISYEEIFSDQHNHKYKLSNVDGAVYGNILNDKWCNARVTIDDLTYLTSQWLGISVFYIPTESGEVIVNFSSEDEINTKIHPQFYALNENILSRLANAARDRQVEFVTFGDTHIKFEVDGTAGEKLFTSIPYDEGWNVVCNGDKAEPQLVANYFMGFTLQNGKNVFEMVYVLPGLKIGIVISVLSCIFLILYSRYKFCKQFR